MPHTTVFERHAPSASAIAHLLEGSEHGSFWIADAPAARRPAVEEPLRADLAVVGGGYLGLWSALLAKQRDPGSRVVLLEAERVGLVAERRQQEGKRV